MAVFVKLMKGFHARTRSLCKYRKSKPIRAVLFPFSHSRRVDPSLSLYTFALDHLNFQPAEREKLATYFLKALCPSLKHAPSIEISDRDVSESRLDRILFRELYSRRRKKGGRLESFARLAPTRTKMRECKSFVGEKNCGSLW